MSATTDKELVITASMFAAMCRLQHLTMHRNGWMVDGLVIPLSADEEAEFQRLNNWWRHLGGSNQVRMHDLAKKFSQAINLDDGRRDNAVEEAVKKVIIAPGGNG